MTNSTDDQDNFSDIDELSLEILSNIFSFVKFWRDIRSLRACCKRFNSIILQKKDYLFENMKSTHFFVKYDDETMISKKDMRIKNASNIYEIAIQLHHDQLCKVPESFRTKYVCELALEKNMYNFPYVPMEYITPSLIIMMHKNHGGYFIIKNEHIHYKCREVVDLCLTEYSDELCEIIVHKNVFTFKYIPDDFKTHRVCTIAVEKNENNIKFVPHAMKEYFIEFHAMHHGLINI